ncbi:hypothetical protein HK101_003474 [Irineochytrium annulatum]|nr:hypothetical protein HK101_003474 [Irineochytrium annulatum]
MTFFSITRDPFFTDAFFTDPLFDLLSPSTSDQQGRITGSGDQQQQQGQGQTGGQVAKRRRTDDNVFFRGMRMDLTETDKGYTIRADLPGMNKEEVNISVKDDILTIAGERSQTNEQKDEKRHLVERSYGKFSRSVRLPQDANQEAISAQMNNGVLEVNVARREIPPEQAPKKIMVQ